MNPHHGGPTAPPSPWVEQWAHLLAPASRVLDVACGSGRHLDYLLRLGHQVTGIDQDTAAASAAVPKARLIVADIENKPWPLLASDGPEKFDAVIVCNYLWRPLWPALLDSVTEGGLLIYETFTQGQEQFGRPRRADFLLQPGELLQVCQGMQIVAYACGIDMEPRRAVQRIVATRQTPLTAAMALRSLK